jgi:hypothetical protein
VHEYIAMFIVASYEAKAPISVPIFDTSLHLKNPSVQLPLKTNGAATPVECPLCHERDAHLVFGVMNHQPPPSAVIEDRR